MYNADYSPVISEQMKRKKRTQRTRMSRETYADSLMMEMR